MSANVETGGRKVDGISSLRIEQVTGGVENSPDGVQAVEITVEEQSTPTSVQGRSVESDDRGEGSDEDDTEPSVLQALSSEQLARRASFKKILDDLSSADQTLKNHDHLAVAAAATLQAQAQQVALQQAAAAAAAGGMANSALIPGLMQQIATVAPPTSSSGESQLPAQLSVMLPSQQQIQSAILSATSLGAATHSPLLAGAMQSLANQTIPASLLSSALLNASVAATLSSSTSSTGIPGNNVTITSPSSSSSKSGQVGLASPGVQQVLDDTTKKREIRLMKNRDAARECRRKKKEYVRCLENRVSVLESQNQALIGELRALKELYLPKSSQE